MIPATLFHLRVADTLKGIDIASLRSPSRHIYVEPQLNKQTQEAHTVPHYKAPIYGIMEYEGLERDGTFVY